MSDKILSYRAYDRYGSWGALEYLEQRNEPTAYKHNALTQYIADHPIAW